MAIVERSARKWFPGSLVMVEVPFVCLLHPTIQELAREIQEGKIGPHHATIRNGRIYTDLTQSEILSACLFD